MECWKSYGKLANQIPGLEKLWKNVILVRCPGNVLEFILEHYKFQGAQHLHLVVIIGEKDQRIIQKYGQKNPNFVINVEAPTQDHRRELLIVSIWVLSTFCQKEHVLENLETCPGIVFEMSWNFILLKVYEPCW